MLLHCMCSLPSGQASTILLSTMLLCTCDRKRRELVKDYEQKLARLTKSASLAEQLKLCKRAAMWTAVETRIKEVEHNAAQQVTVLPGAARSMVCEVYSGSCKTAHMNDDIHLECRGVWFVTLPNGGQAGQPLSLSTTASSCLACC